MRMIAALVFRLFAASAEMEASWQDLSLTIFTDPDVSSDTATICRVRVENRGRRNWSGSRLRFEAEALEGSEPVELRRGRFGLTLGPGERLETVVGFSGRFHSFRVRWLGKESSVKSREPRGRSARRRKR
jgi:hypothetical protein